MKLLRIGMWSGPRNISTAMMRSWENRSDTTVVDEPLYGHYLHQTQKKHAMYAEIIEEQGSDLYSTINHLTKGKLINKTTIYFQKHMCQHILADMDISWIKSLKNAFLIRNPEYVLASYIKKHDHVTAENLGFPQQLKLFNFVKDHCGYTPVVMESKDILKNPQAMMPLLCEKLGVQFDKNMLSWPKGYRASDGIWAPHWYNRVIESTEFGQFKPKKITLNSKQQAVADECMPYYLAMQEYKVTTNDN